MTMQSLTKRRGISVANAEYQKQINTVLSYYLKQMPDF